ncbi:TPA: hypothetical protein NHH99_001085 [Legionella pneumophila]|nr:hypothetical protein [Legionella pneumophila]HCE5494700.1 hypothetical protein [Legionella pneumophila]
MSVSERILKKLETSGFVYIFERMIYVNKEKKIIISNEALEDKSDDEIEAEINAESTDWKFIFSNPPSENIKNKLKDLFEKNES